MIKPLVQDDIVALATPPGIGAIAVIRVSGQNLISLYKKIINKNISPIPRYANYITIFDNNKNKLDNCLITYFKGPNSFTGEDVLEISSHGGEFIPKAILTLLYSLKVRQASPGEFSYRAFINGKIDLIQAEAISGLISSKTSKNAQVQLNNLDGNLSRSISTIRNKLINLLTILEHELDFTEDEISFTTTSEINLILNEILLKIENIISSSNFGKAINIGIRVVLFGKPNAGKSSLFNRLSGSEKAIVTNIPGTTRDTIESWLEISGIPVCIIDTAGIIDSKDEVEMIGIQKSMREFKNADIILLLDENNPLEFYKQQRMDKLDKKIILIHTKSDLASSEAKSINSINISTKTNLGIKQLYTELSTHLKQSLTYDYSKDPVVVSKRQRALLISTVDLFNEANKMLNNDLDLVLLSSLLHEITEILEELLGKISNEDIFNNLFSSFCIGK
jgi:tRNA modification GTPase